MSIVVRLPEQLYQRARRFAELQGRPTTEVLAEAWERYERDQARALADDLEATAQALREGAELAEPETKPKRRSAPRVRAAARG
ncbi:MAG TPA: hypothetical protein VMS02_02415 [Solirubrobacteraceae bacterium]|nr:hypothetical protein [Solirubrobacteraceae bacterium]